MNKLNYEILSAIDNIDSTIMESEINVMNSLISSYDKAIMILENCNDNTDVDSFDIFQESVIMEADNNVKKESKVKKIINKIIDTFIFGLKQIWSILKNLFKNKKEPVKPITEKGIELVKQSVGDDKVVVTVSTTISDVKPEVKVSTASHDTEKEEQIKSQIEQDDGFNNIIYRYYGKNCVKMKETSRGSKHYKVYDEEAYRYKIDNSTKIDDLTITIEPNGDVMVNFFECRNSLDSLSNNWERFDNKIRSLDVNQLDVLGYIGRFVDEFYTMRDEIDKNLIKYNVTTSSCLGFITLTEVLIKEIRDITDKFNKTCGFMYKIASKYKKDHNINCLNDTVNSDEYGVKPENYKYIERTYEELKDLVDEIYGYIIILKRVKERLERQEILVSIICESIAKKSDDGKDYYEDAKRAYYKTH